MANKQIWNKSCNFKASEKKMIFVGLVIYVATANGCPAGTRSNIPKQNSPTVQPYPEIPNNEKVVGIPSGAPPTGVPENVPPEKAPP